MQWRPILYSAQMSDGYGFTVCHAEDHDTATLIRTLARGQIERPYDATASWIVGANKGRTYFGTWDWIENVLGASHPGAHDKAGRPRAFFLGYTAADGSSVPRFSDIKREDMQRDMRADLERLWNEVDNRGQPLKMTALTILPDFSKTPITDHVWDKTVAAIEAGRPAPAVLIDQQGVARAMEMPEITSTARTATQVENLVTNTKGSLGRFWSESKWMGGKGLAVVGGVVALGAIIYGVKAYLDNRNKTQQQPVHHAKGIFVRHAGYGRFLPCLHGYGRWQDMAGW